MMERLALVFPGQGSQAVGMGRSWAESHAAARRAFDEADAALPGLTRLCWEGPEDELQLTANTQPAILATSIAIQRSIAERGVDGLVMAGHSLGEYSALVASGALEFGEALRIVKRRGELMQEAVPVGEGAMAAVIGLDAEAVQEVAAQAAEDQICTVANYNGPQQTVVAGHREAVERLVPLARERGAKRALLLKVSAPFHSPLMRPAREGLTPVLEAAVFEDPNPPVVSNVDAASVGSGDAARQALIRQVDGPVRWVESVRRMVEEFEVDLFVEVGPGAVLTGLIRRISRESRTLSLAEPGKLDDLLGESEVEK